MFMIYDTETTDVSDRPHLVQFAAILIDDFGVERHSLSMIVALPDGVEMPDDTARIHGITTMVSRVYGLPLQMAVAAFSRMARLCHTIAAFNAQFDERVMSAALGRIESKVSFAQIIEHRRIVDIMAEASAIMKMPPTEKMVRAGFNKQKPPKLHEAYEWFIGGAFKAHSASDDCRAAYGVLRAVERHRIEAPA
jgi:DNA polymerase-3 subunit epsilon